MADKPIPESTNANAASAKQILMADIGAKWRKFTQKELSGLKTDDDLVTKVVAKYGLTKDVAQRDVKAVMNGRTF